MKRAMLLALLASLSGARAVQAQDEIVEAQAMQAESVPDTVTPPGPAPTDLPSAPPMQPPPPPVADEGAGPMVEEVEPAPQAGPATGQWVYTSQYGWVFMPYGNQYVYEGTTADAYPYAYVYCAPYGWSWVVSPWVWGWGPYPYFGTFGPSRFNWYNGLVTSGWGWGRYRGGPPGGAPAVARGFPRGAPRGDFGHRAPAGSGLSRGPSTGVRSAPVFRGPANGGFRPTAPAASPRPVAPASGFHGGGGMLRGAPVGGGRGRR